MTANTQIKSVIERVERLLEEKKAIQDDISDIYKEAKGNGLDVKVLRRIVRDRKRSPAEVQEEEALYELYQTQI